MAVDQPTTLASELRSRTGRALGAVKVAASKTGLSFDDYLARVDAGEKWCTACDAWHSRASFVADRSRWDGLSARCAAAASQSAKAKYVPRPIPRGRFFVPARDGDRKQARARVNHRIRMGMLPNPNALPCFDCGHTSEASQRRRHEYDHHLGYAAEHHFDVQPVCTKCHAKRSIERGEIDPKKPRHRRG